MTAARLGSATVGITASRIGFVSNDLCAIDQGKYGQCLICWVVLNLGRSYPGTSVDISVVGGGASDDSIKLGMY